MLNNRKWDDVEQVQPDLNHLPEWVNTAVTDVTYLILTRLHQGLPRLQNGGIKMMKRCLANETGSY